MYNVDSANLHFSHRIQRSLHFRVIYVEVDSNVLLRHIRRTNKSVCDRSKEKKKSTTDQLKGLRVYLKTFQFLYHSTYRSFSF